MFSGFSFFQKQYEKLLKIDFSFDARLSPWKALQQLKSPTSQKQFLKRMTKKTNNGFKIMRRLTIANIILMESNKFYHLIQQFVENPINSVDEWLNNQCISTYYHFLKKCVISMELYERAKENSSRWVGFQLTFYLINLFMDMFKIVAKMPLLGRYFKQSNQIVTCTFIQVIAVQAQKLYSAFKNCLIQMISNHKKYIKNREQEKLMKVVLQQSLPQINQQMKKLFLDKYFYPYGRGICVKLFRIQQQPEPSLKLINGIISDHKETERMEAHQQLQKTLFPEDGRIDLQFYERTLKPIDGCIQQVAIQLEDIEEQLIPTNFDEEDEEVDQRDQAKTTGINEQKQLRKTSEQDNKQRILYGF